jgi:ABC-2 type transport system permease protein
MEVRSGALALRMLRPVHPLLQYAASSLAELPVRGLLSVPVAFVALFAVAGSRLTHDPVMWLVWTVSIALGWIISVLVSFALGLLALFLESSLKVMDVYIALFFVFSGYLIPVELFPPALRAAADLMPFRYQLGLPVEIMTGAYTLGEAGAMVARQGVAIAVLGAVVAFVWARGARRFAAFGG